MPPTKEREDELYKKGYQYIVGIDEVGRGAWAGPVVAAAVVLPHDCPDLAVDDSKVLSEKKRDALYDEIIACATDYAFGVVGADVIDAIGIFNATIRAMQQAISSLKQVDYILVDAITFTGGIPSESIIKGDARIRCIAAASIIAKVHRDKMMKDLAREYPEYGFEMHKGYGVAMHQEALKSHGPCPIHRKSFAPIKQTFQLGLFSS